MSETHHPQTQEQEFLPPGQSDHEHSDVRVTGIIWFLVGLTITLIVISLLLVVLFNFLVERARQADAPPPPLVDLRRPPVGPRLQPNPVADMEALRKRENALLHEERAATETEPRRIPIEAAMQRVVSEGLPMWPPVEESSAGGGSDEGESAPPMTTNGRDVDQPGANSSRSQPARTEGRTQ